MIAIVRRAAVVAMLGLVAGATPSKEPGVMDPRLKKAMETQRQPAPDFSAVHSPSLAAPLTHPESLWRFLTAPQTPYLQRRAAAVQAPRSATVALLPRLVSAIRELRSEQELHRFGLTLHPLDSRPRMGNPVVTQRNRVILGHPWTLPDQPVDHPLDFDEESAAPWPWQVQQALQDLLGRAYPHSSIDATEWLAACMRLPWSTDEEALSFVEVTQGSSHIKTLPVMARWRAVALDPRFPSAAVRVASSLGEATRLWDDANSQLMGEVITVDILRDSPHREARHQAAYGLHSLTTRFHDGSELRLPAPSTALLEVMDRAVDPGEGDVWTRLYVFGFSALEAMTAPPMAPDRRMDPNPPLPVDTLAKLTQWWKQNRPAFQAAADEEAPRLRKLRAELMALSSEK